MMLKETDQNEGGFLMKRMEAVNSSHSRSPLRSLRWESSPQEEGGCDEENFQDEDGLSGEDDEDDISVDLSTWTENEWNDFFDYDRSVDDCNDEEENKEENKKWMRPSSVGHDIGQWYKNIQAVAKKAKECLQNPNYDNVFDVMVAQGCSQAQLLEIADVLSSKEHCKYDTLLVRLCDVIKGSGIAFSEKGDIFSAIKLPKNPTQVAEHIVSQDKEFRKDAGSVNNEIAGRPAASLGQPLNLKNKISAFQHWATTDHEQQKDPEDLIDFSACNREIRSTTARWLVCDAKGVKYDAAVTLPTNFEDQLRISDHYPISINKHERKQNSNAKKPPTDVDGQVKRFLTQAKTNVDRLALLPLLYSCVSSIVTKLMGNHNTFLVFSVEVYKRLECPPPMKNSLVDHLGAVVHAQNIVAAGKQLRKYHDEHLAHMMSKIVKFYSGPLELSPHFQSKMLSIRSGRSEMTDEMKQLLKDEGNPLLEWMKKATPEQLRERARKRVETMGPDRLSAAARKGHARKDEKGRSLKGLQRAKTMGPDRLSEAARKSHATRAKKPRAEKQKKEFRIRTVGEVLDEVRRTIVRPNL
eukprot:scaffold20385_cov110-Skeletonema_marinoi.AAC.1